jgi:hypothetical protein
MTQYVSRFIPNYASITTPLRTLIHQNAKWQWQAEQENALKKLQHELTNDPVMAYFDPSKPTTVIVDASPSGLGALLTQEGRVISCGSRALSSVEYIPLFTNHIYTSMVLSLLSSPTTSRYSESSKVRNRLQRESTAGN